MKDWRGVRTSAKCRLKRRHSRRRSHLHLLHVLLMLLLLLLLHLLLVERRHLSIRRQLWGLRRLHAEESTLRGPLFDGPTFFLRYNAFAE